jgi:DNA mismatch repair protein MSH4
MQMLLKHYREKYDLPSLKLQYNARRGHFFSLDGGNISMLPDTFIQIVKKGKKLTSSSEDLVRLNQRSSDSLSEISLMTER